MTELSDVDKSKISAETASVNRKKAARIGVDLVMERIEKYDGVGLLPSEVWSLYNEIKSLRGLYTSHLNKTSDEIGR